MTMHILAYAPAGREFATADAINDMGALAVVPRKAVFADHHPGGYDYRPFLPNYIFLAISPEQWHHVRTNPLYYQKRVTPKKGLRAHPSDKAVVSAILQPPHHVLDILPRTWADFQGFAERCEIAAQLRIEQFEAGERVAGYKPGDRIRILGNLLDGQLKDKLGVFIGCDKVGRIIVKPDGVEMMGKAITVTLGAHEVEGIAAE